MMRTFLAALVGLALVTGSSEASNFGRRVFGNSHCHRNVGVGNYSYGHKQEVIVAVPAVPVAYATFVPAVPVAVAPVPAPVVVEAPKAQVYAVPVPALIFGIGAKSYGFSRGY